ncbi:MAG: C-terminal target protein [Ignavibacteria bacterium]|nr:C-terminal target protein [Ignavibacteria bacterium]
MSKFFTKSVLLFILFIAAININYAQSLTVLHNYDWGYSGPYGDGWAPASYSVYGGQDILYYNGRIYGMTLYGGPYTGSGGDGVIFSCEPDGSDYRILYNFEEATYGSRPWGALIEVGGVLYGSTYYGGSGAGARGILFSINPFNGLPYTPNYTILHTFTYPDDAYYPKGTPYHYNGKLYGLLTGGPGGSPSYGGIYSYNLGNSTYSLIHTFTSSQAYEAVGSLIIYNNRLYGMAQYAGTNDGGTIYSIDPANVADFQVHYSFPANYNPLGSLVVYNNKLYGTTYNGGTYTYGTIFYFDPSNNSVTTIYSLGTTAAHCNGSLVLYNAKLWGFSQYGSSGACGGTLFSINPDGSSFQVAYAFSCSGGSPERPQGTPMVSNNYFYGQSSYGGANNDGAVFRYGAMAAPAVLSEASISNINSTYATATGNITNIGGSNCTVRGFCWGVSINPTTSGSHTTENGSFSTGTFTAQITELIENTTYHVRDYAINSAGTSYGDDVTFTTASSAAATPTLSEWALIVLLISAAGFGSWFVIKNFA